MDIKKYVSSLALANGTNNPFEIAENKGIVVLMEPLGSIRGYYSKALKTKFIHINENMDERKQLFTCAHELGHALLHPNLSTPFLRDSTLFSINKLEVQANRFAVSLTYPADYLKQEFEGCSICQISEALRLPMDLIEYAMK